MDVVIRNPNAILSYFRYQHFSDTFEEYKNTMTTFEISEIRSLTKKLHPAIDFDSSYSFYYDETNNIRKFYVKEEDFNYTYDSNFVLGGVVTTDNSINTEDLFKALKLQDSVKEVKLKHIAKGDFISCLSSNKLTTFFQYILNSNLFIHYSSINILYYSLVDIVDSAIANSKAALQLGQPFALHLKNDLYKLARLEKDSVVEVFYHYEYPNIKNEEILNFIDSLISLFRNYENEFEFHIGLTSLKQILKEARKKGSLPFIMDEEDYILLPNFSQFYLRPLYTFRNSSHVFDNEEAIKEILNDYELTENGTSFKNYTFEDSTANRLIQISDIFTGLVGKFTTYRNTSSIPELQASIQELSAIQKENFQIYFDLIEKSLEYNPAFLHSIDSIDEIQKIEVIKELLHS
jgi:hypothetical protein